MGNDSSSSRFDLDSKAGVMHLLASLRSSEVSSEVKNDLRDLVLSFANSGGDHSLRLAIEQKISTHEIVPIVLKQTAAQEASSTPLAFGSRRPLPTFAGSTIKSPTPEAENKATPAVNAVSVEPSVISETGTQVATPSPSSIPVPDPAPAAIPTPEPVVSEVIVPEPTVSTPSVEPRPVIRPIASPLAQKPTPIPTPSKPPLRNIAVPRKPLSEVTDLPRAVSSGNGVSSVQRPAVVVNRDATPITSRPVATLSPDAPSATSDAAQQSGPNPQSLERIRQIKSAVNDRIGNPVNLVDIDNEIGREYMTALLEAMKRLSGGAAGQLDQAMLNLESAFSKVQKVLDQHESTRAEPTVVDEVKETTPVVTNNPSKPPVLQRPIVNISSPSQPIVKSHPIPIRNAPISQLPTNNDRATIPSSDRRMVIEEIVDDNKKPEPVSGFESPVYQAKGELPIVGPKTTSEPAPVATPNFTAAPMSPLGQITPQATPSSNKTILLEEQGGNDPLMEAEVDEGLEQLLSDWILFKKSGLFGTGPKGREHPLFKKLATLPITLLLAGRFEGSNQEIKQSITDYMNGWRYEQGIIYEQGETFEHYLRRIIRHILDLQKRQRKA